MPKICVIDLELMTGRPPEGGAESLADLMEGLAPRRTPPLTPEALAAHDPNFASETPEQQAFSMKLAEALTGERMKEAEGQFLRWLEGHDPLTGVLVLKTMEFIRGVVPGGRENAARGAEIIEGIIESAKVMLEVTKITAEMVKSRNAESQAETKSPEDEHVGQHEPAAD